MALASALVMLGGCNTVVTTTPLFASSDEVGAPRLKDGVWSSCASAACAFDETTLLDSWPACASGGVVGPGTMRAYRQANSQRVVSATQYVLAAAAPGEPMVLQLHGVDLAPGSGLTFSGYLYGGLRVKKTDDQGQITAYSAWLVLCGPPPPNTAGTAAKWCSARSAPCPGW